MSTSTPIPPRLADAMSLWLDLDSPVIQSDADLLREAASLAKDLSANSPADEVANTIRWIEQYATTEDRQITLQLCEAANRDWLYSTETKRKLQDVMQTILKTLKGLQGVRTAS